MRKKIVPIFGSGITFGCKAARGLVPDSDIAREQMINLIVSSNAKIAKEQLCLLPFNKIALHFVNCVNETTKANYFRNHYTEVNIIGKRKEMLELPWVSIANTEYFTKTQSMKTDAIIKRLSK